MTLAELPIRHAGVVSQIALEGPELGWVRAVGIFEGENVVVLRRALFGGPLHVRTGSGGEFALDARLASRIEVDASKETK